MNQMLIENLHQNPSEEISVRQVLLLLRKDQIQHLRHISSLQTHLGKLAVIFIFIDCTSHFLASDGSKGIQSIALD